MLHSLSSIYHMGSGGGGGDGGGVDRLFGCFGRFLLGVLFPKPTCRRHLLT